MRSITLNDGTVWSDIDHMFADLWVLQCRQDKDALRPVLMWCQSNRCYVCKRHRDEFNREFDTHRVVPGTLGGEYTLENTVLVCNSCHTQIEGMNWDLLQRSVVMEIE